MQSSQKLRDALTIVVLAFFLFSCYATTHRGPWALEPGEVSASGNYMHFFEEDMEEPGKLASFEGRVGLPGKVDIGYMRTIDLTEGLDEDEGMDTHWMDAKIQLANRQNIEGKPTLAFGYGFGNLVHPEEPIWVNTLYLSAGIEQKKLRTFYTFKVEAYDEEMHLVPEWLWEEDFTELMKSNVIGFEYAVTPNIRPVIELGRYHTEEIADGMNVFSLGLNYYTGSLIP